MHNKLLLLFFFNIYTFVSPQGFVLITSLYNEKNTQRVDEYIFCLKKNVTHKSIEKIHILYDTNNNDNQNKLLKFLKDNPAITISYIKGRPTFDYMFTLTNQLYNNKNIIISNADIYFDETLSLLDQYDLENKMLSLTRWDVDQTGKIKPAFNLSNNSFMYGADTWIYRTPLRPIPHSKIELGTWGCDGGIIYQIAKSGLKIVNPACDIRCCHLHTTGIRNYSKK